MSDEPKKYTTANTPSPLEALIAIANEIAGLRGDLVDRLTLSDNCDNVADQIQSVASALESEGPGSIIGALDVIADRVS